ncbi:MAG TPA: hypothetical protein VL651_14155 [Bacteroidia bacterium]|nr:hypothetical protein [Bacteroidia bacterium]
MRYSTLLFFIVLSICSCKQPETKKPFPFPYKWTDSVIDYSITHQELTLKFPNHTAFKRWLFEVQVDTGYSDFFIDTVNPREYPVVNDEVHIPVQINDSFDLDKLRYTLFGEPWDCQLFGRQENGKFYDEGREPYILQDGRFHLFPRVLKMDWYIAPDSLFYSDSANYYYMRMMQPFVKDSTEAYPLSIRPE